tara:strand:+ start:13721 stop:13834 length:114 start_codon:yes stop_codon:yes gene_type:complete
MIAHLVVEPKCGLRPIIEWKLFNIRVDLLKIYDIFLI